MFPPTLLKLAVHSEVTPTFAFGEIFCRVASPQTRRVWQGNRARWPSSSCPGPSLPLSPASASPSVITFLVFFPVVKIASSCTVKNGNIWVCMWRHPHSLACHGRPQSHGLWYSNKMSHARCSVGDRRKHFQPPAWAGSPESVPSASGGRQCRILVGLSGCCSHSGRFDPGPAKVGLTQVPFFTTHRSSPCMRGLPFSPCTDHLPVHAGFAGEHPWQNKGSVLWTINAFSKTFSQTNQTKEWED